MASIKNTISVAGGVINYLIVVIYKTTALGAEVDRVVYHAGVSPNPFNYAFTDLVNGTYVVKVHESVDGTTLGTLRHDYWIDASTGQITQERVFFTVNSGIGTAPAAGATIFSDPSLDGKTISGVFRTGYGYLTPSTEWQPHAGGGFELLGGLNFSDSEVWCFEISYTVIETAPSPNDAFADIEVFATDTTLTSADYNKTILGNSANPSQTFTLPTIAGVPDGKGFVFIHDGGSAKNLTLSGGTYRFRGADVTAVHLGKGEKVKVIKKTISGSPKWYVVDCVGQWDRIGERKGVELLGDNMLICDGTEYDGLVYKRFFDYIKNTVPLGQKVSYAVFDTTTVINGETVYAKRGFYAVDLVNNKFKVPDLRNTSVRFLKNIGGADATRVDNVPGGYQHHDVGAHKHTGLTAENTSHASASSIQAVPNVKLLVNTSAGSVTSVSQAETGVYNTGGETVTRNVGLIPVVLI